MVNSYSVFTYTPYLVDNPAASHRIINYGLLNSG
jgi:hypothetical protein